MHGVDGSEEQRRSLKMAEEKTEERGNCGCQSETSEVPGGCCASGPQPFDIPVITNTLPTAATKTKQADCCGQGQNILVDTSGLKKTPPWVTGVVKSPGGIVPRVATVLRTSDRLGSWKARWGVGRMHYEIRPGLYAVGAPDQDSPVLVSANYKMSFDRLRKELGDISAWILVLDTKGINVWCAAGKGTFGTDEIVERLTRVGLGQIVTHRTLILPQLGAPGVAAHEVQKKTGFRIAYGPVRARDLPAFLKTGRKTTEEMRRVHFGFLDRLVLTPMEVVGVIKPALVLLALLFVLNLVRNFSAPFPILLSASILAFLPFLGAIITGAVLTPTLLPYIPGRAFAWKGWLLGFVLTLCFILSPSVAIGWEAGLFYLLVLPAISSYLAMNFTGASTYTSLSGVVHEMRTAVPAQIISAGAGLVFIIVAFAVGL